MLTLTSIVSWTGWFLVVTRLDPEEMTGTFPFIMFYLTLFLAVMGTASVISFYIRVWLTQNEIYFEHLNLAIREGFIAAVICLMLLWLKYFRVLTIWDALLLTVAAVLLEIFLITKKKG